MKQVSETKIVNPDHAPVTGSPKRVCMHVRDSVRGDYRILREALALKEAGFEVHIVDIETDPSLPVVEEIQSITVHHVIVPGLGAPLRFKPWYLVTASQLLARCVSQLAQLHGDIYHAHDDMALTATYIAARLRRKPLIFDAHEFPLFQQPLSTLALRHRWLRALSLRRLRYMVPRCSAVITVSAPIAQGIRSVYHAKAVSLVRNIPPYQVVAKNDQLRHHLGLGPEARIALYQGNIQPNRGLDTLIRAAPFLDPSITLVFMGRGSQKTYDQLNALIAEKGVAERVKLLPSVPYKELLMWTGSADIGLIVYSPDYSLNVRMCLPNKIFEYLMVGLPVLVSQLDAVAELVTTYDCGRVVCSLAPENVATAINSTLEDREALAQMSHNALQAAQHDLNWETESKQLIKVYQAFFTDGQ